MNLAFRLGGGDGTGGRLPGSLQVNRRLAQWLRFRADGIVEVFPGKVEIGQGIVTALAQIAAEELDVPVERIRMIPATTGLSPDEAVTSGSLSIQECGTALRYACAEARALCLEAAAAQFGVEPERLTVEAGEILGPGAARTSYGALADDLLDREATGRIPPKSVDAYSIVGRPVQRLDLPGKVFGEPRFIHDLAPNGMLHGRVLRPAAPGAMLAALDERPARAIPGVVAIVRDGSFVGVVAEGELAATTALERLAAEARWEPGETLPDEEDLAVWLRAQPVETKLIAEGGEGWTGGAARTVRARYTRPYLAHASIGPSCALAQWHVDALRVWSHSQGIYNLRTDLALAFAIDPETVTVQHVEAAGCYGHNAADDVALDAAILARAVRGRPVRVQWTRADEFGWGPLGPAMLIELEADLDDSGEILAWRHDVWSNGHGTRPGRAKTPALLAAWHLAEPFARPIAVNAPLAAGGGSERNAVPAYSFPAWRAVNHRVLTMPLRASALRSLGAHANVFAIESFLDEIASAGGDDPVDFRLRRLADARARAVVEAAAVRFGWGTRRKTEGVGHGIGFARYKNTGAYCAVIAEVEAEREIRVRRLVIAVDVGLVINPDGAANQIEGGAIQATSWTLKERVGFDRARVTSVAWEDYPILRFSEVPAVEVEILSRPEEPSLGAGEAAQGPTAAAIGNAVFDALGVRVRDLPITPERIVAAME